MISNQLQILWHSIQLRCLYKSVYISLSTCHQSAHSPSCHRLPSLLLASVIVAFGSPPRNFGSLACVIDERNETRKKRPARKTCSIVGCEICSGDIQAWICAVCNEHAPARAYEFPCLVPLSMHRFPNRKKNEERRHHWLAKLQRKNFNPVEMRW